MSVAADDAGLSEDPEFRSALVAYLEWGTRLAMGNSQPGAHVVAHAPVPRRGCGGASPTWAERETMAGEDLVGGVRPTA